MSDDQAKIKEVFGRLVDFMKEELDNEKLFHKAPAVAALLGQMCGMAEDSEGAFAMMVHTMLENMKAYNEEIEKRDDAPVD